MDDCLHRILRDAVRSSVTPGAIVWVECPGREPLVVAAGRLSPRSRYPVDRDTIYDLASLTKPLSTATCLLRLVQKRAISIDQPLADFIDGRSPAWTRRVTLRHLATHTSGLAAWERLYAVASDREDLIGRLLRRRPSQPPGSHYEYSCLGYILLGWALERASGLRLDALFHREVAAPLGLDGVGYLPERRWACAPTERCRVRGCRIRGRVHDENAWRMGGVSGNAGLFASANGLGCLLRAWSTAIRGLADWLTPDAVAAATQNQLDGDIGTMGCGWFLPGNPLLQFAAPLGPEVVGHSGFTGVSAVINHRTASFAFLLTNRVFFGRDFHAYGAFRRQCYARIADLMPAGS